MPTIYNKYRVQLRNVSNVSASKTALIDLPCGPRYHQLVLQHGYSSGSNSIGGAFANILEARLKVNGKVQRTFSGLQLRDMNILNGSGFDAVTGEAPNTAPGVSMPVFFSEPWRQVPAEADSLAWPSSGWRSFQLEVDLGAASTPTLIAWAIVDDKPAPADAPPGLCKWIRQQWNASATSFDIATIDRRDWLQQISLYPDSGTTRATAASSSTTSGSASIGFASGQITAADVGRIITGTGIPAGSYLVSFDSATTGTLSQAATATGSSLVFTVYGGIGISKATMRLNGNIVHELTAQANGALLQQHTMTPKTTGRTAGVYDLALDHDGLLASAPLLDGARDLTLTLESAAAMSGTITAIIQRLGPPE